MRKGVLACVVFVCICLSTLVSKAQIFTFPDPQYFRELKLNTINFVRFNGKEQYYALNDERKYFAQVKYGINTFECNIYDSSSKQLKLGIYPLKIAFYRTSKDDKGEQYEGTDGRSIYVLTFSTAKLYKGFNLTQNADKYDWFEETVSIYIYEKNKSTNNVTTEFLGFGSYIYNPKTQVMRTK